MPLNRTRSNDYTDKPIMQVIEHLREWIKSEVSDRDGNDAEGGEGTMDAAGEKVAEDGEDTEAEEGAEYSSDEESEDEEEEDEIDPEDEEENVSLQ